MNFVRDYILPRLKKRSTYVGLVALATAFGIAVDPAYVDVLWPLAQLSVA